MPKYGIVGLTANQQSLFVEEGHLIVGEFYTLNNGEYVEKI